MSRVNVFFFSGINLLGVHIIFIHYVRYFKLLKELLSIIYSKLPIHKIRLHKNCEEGSKKL